jgi:ectoine hydroxylase-related dioxygenase (phytanoyl-CoA dioxygenase family)
LTTLLTMLRLTEDERRQGTFSAERLQLAKDKLLADGCLQIENVFDPGLIRSLHADFMQRCSGYLQDRAYVDALTVGDKRFMVTVALTGAFNNPAIYAPAAVYQLMAAVLGPKYILSSFGGVLSLPGSPAQHIHRDMILFDGSECDGRIPPFAITLIIPLVPLNPITGATRLFPGTHHNPTLGEIDYVDPVTELGACLLMDYTLVHSGMANQSSAVRPILYNVYARPWFRDSENYSLQDSLVLDPGALERIPEAYRHLFNAVKRQGPPTASNPSSP